MAFGKTMRRMKKHARKSKGLYNESSIAAKLREEERPNKVRRITKEEKLRKQFLKDWKKCQALDIDFNTYKEMMSGQTDSHL
mgnify:CR=1 FL=1